MLTNELLESLLLLSQELSSAGIKHWLDGGTLLGVIREKKLISYDHDLDMGVTADAFKSPGYERMIRATKKAGWRGYWVGQNKIKFQHPTGINIDFFRFIREPQYYTHVSFKGYMHFNLELIDTLTSVEVGSGSLPVPSNPELYLENVYGPLWRFPIAKFIKPAHYRNHSYTQADLSLRARKPIFIFDIDGTITPPRQPITSEMYSLLSKLSIQYRVFFLGAGSCNRIATQTKYLPGVPTWGAYGLEKTIVHEGNIIPMDKTQVSLNITPEQEAQLVEFRKKYGFTNCAGKTLEIHPSGIATFPFLGTEAPIADKIKFDPDKSIRQKHWYEFCKILPQCNIIIGGTSSYDILPKGIDKSFGINKITSEYYDTAEEWIFYFGDDFGMNCGDYGTLQSNINTIPVASYHKTTKILQQLLLHGKVYIEQMRTIYCI